jgi:hypothetical protein
LQSLVISPVELWGHVAPHFRTLDLQNSSSASGGGGGLTGSIKSTVFPLQIIKTSNGVMRLTTEDEQFEHLNRAEVQAKPVAKFIA